MDKDSDWSEWHGGECPVHRETLLSVRFRGEPDDEGSNPYRAWTMTWKHDGGIADIIAYRILDPQS